MAVSPEVGGIAGALFIIANILAFWFREWRKHKTWNKNGQSLMQIEEKVDEVKNDVADVNGKVEDMNTTINTAKLKLTEVGTMVKEQKDNCTKTVKRIDTAIASQAKEMIALAKNKK